MRLVRAAAPVAFLALLALGAAGGVALAIKLPRPHKSAELFPLAHGAEWRFSVKAGAAPAREEKWSVVRRCGSEAIVSRGGAETKLRVTPGAVHGPSGAPWIADPVSAGKTWTPRPGVTVRITASYVSARCPLGKYAGCATVTRLDVDPDARLGEEVTTTLCPSIGPVRIITQSLTDRAPDPDPVVLELVGYTAGKGSTPGCAEPGPDREPATAASKPPAKKKP